MKTPTKISSLRSPLRFKISPRMGDYKVSFPHETILSKYSSDSHDFDQYCSEMNKLGELSSRMCHCFKVPLKVPLHSTSHDGRYHFGEGVRIVDFLCFSHDVTLLNVVLPYDGALEIKDRSYRTLRAVSSGTGDYLLDEPLELKARKFYRIYLTSQVGVLDLYRGLDWQRSFGDVTVSWGNCTTVDGLDLWICV
ncbi:uncharacterized protein LOC143025460 [Oratosquilla oratoria]|uniref:uncharacterized protein LOC143025460 n=1 Tax=Oratosquilla oratoria TaxID=337810 RepID=UPI003F76D7A2